MTTEGQSPSEGIAPLVATPASGNLLSLRAAFTSVGRPTPSDATLQALADALVQTDLEALYRSTRGLFGGTFADQDFRNSVASYRFALIEAADPTALAERLITEAQAAERSADLADQEAGYRARCALDWLAKNATAEAAEYGAQADFQRSHAKHLRAEAAEKLARAEALLRSAQDQRVAA